MKTALITGGAGFIGTNLCDRLLKDGLKVICVDNLFSGDAKNIEHLLGNPNFKFINHNIIDPLDVEEPIDFIYNLACPASPPFYQKDPLFTLNTCYLGLRNMLNLAEKKKAKILQASTSEIYGDPLKHPQDESYWGNVHTMGKRSCYDEGKRIGETLMHEFNHLKGVNTKVIRIFNTYGPYMRIDDGRVVTNFIKQAMNGEDITIYGTGKQTRSFQYIDDLIEGMIRVMNTEDSFHGPINLGNPHEFTILELANVLLEITKSKSKLAFHPLPQDDPCKRKPDITLAKSKLNWEPKIQLKEGLIKTIEYFKNKNILSKK